MFKMSMRMTRASISTRELRKALSDSARLRNDLHARARRVEREAKRNAPRRTGALKTSIHSEFIRKYGLPAVRVGSSLKYAYAQHEGAGPHVIRAKRGGVLVFQGDQGIIRTSAVNHPGNKPTKYLSRALKAAYRP